MVLLVGAVVLIGYLVVLAVEPTATLPRPFDWFGRPASAPTILVVFGVVALLCIVTYWSRRKRSSAAVPVAIVVGLTAIGFILSFSSFLKCHDHNHPPFFTPLIWTASLVKGGVADMSMGNGVCPLPPPVALEVARLAILGAIFIGLAGIATAMFRSQTDRLRAGLARSVTLVVDVDDDSQPMIAGIAGSRGDHSAVVLMTDDPDRQCIRDARRQGARILQVDFTRPENLGSQRFWRTLDSLYLLAADPSTNLFRLSAISQRLAPVTAKLRIPLIVRIDDPWLAEAWRAEQFGRQGGGSDALWAADTVGKYEMTARRLIDQVLLKKSIRQLIVCGTSQLTVAICGEMALRHTEHAFYKSEEAPELPAMALMALNGHEYASEHEKRLERKGFGVTPPPIDVITEAPSVPTVSRLIDMASDPGAVAVILADFDNGAGTQSFTGTRLAARYPTTNIYVWDPTTQVRAEQIPLAGELRTYRLCMDSPDGQAHDNFERATRLIHERYASQQEDRNKPAYRPWGELDDFYQRSNRRQLENALWMVERIAGHTWNTWGIPPESDEPDSPTSLDGLEPLEKMKRLGFSEDAAFAMAKAEWEDWSRYYRKHGWTVAAGPDPQRDEENRKHEKLVADWATTLGDPALKEDAFASLAGVLIELRQLGYRSRPLWQTYRRVGTVTAKRRWRRWIWTMDSGQEARVASGDWQVFDAGHSWSVRDDIFRSSHRRVRGNRWERIGTVLVRPARTGETINSLEGPATAADGDFVIQGDRAEQWPVSRDQFVRRYEGPVPVYEPLDVPAPEQNKDVVTNHPA